MKVIFYISSIIAIIATIKTVINSNPIHALLYLLLSIISLSSIFFLLGSYFAGSVELIIYGGAIMVLFVFVIMILNIKLFNVKQEYIEFKKINWAITLITLLGLFILITYKLVSTKNIFFNIITSNIKQISIDLFNNYILAIEFCSLLLLSGIIIVIHYKK